VGLEARQRQGARARRDPPRTIVPIKAYDVKEFRLSDVDELTATHEALTGRIDFCSRHEDRVPVGVCVASRTVVTRQITLPTSSATSNAPRSAMATPTGRPNASPSSLRKPVKISVGCPEGRPSANGTKITLCLLLGMRFQEPYCPMKTHSGIYPGIDVPAENVNPSGAVWLPSA